MRKDSKYNYPTQWYGGGAETSCGAGSMVRNMGPVIEQVPKIIAELQPELIFELGCGDLNFAKHAVLPSGVQYRGMDIRRHDSWEGHDITEGDIMEARQFSADLIIARDVFIHLPNDMILQVMEKMRCKWLLSTTYPGADNDLRHKMPSAGFMALDLNTRPFLLSFPKKLIPEHAKGKFLGLFQMKP